jgi:hypothetical protein
MPPAGVAGAVTPADDEPVAYPAALDLKVANARSFGVSEIIHRQHIWQRSSDGWRPMSDRCSPTANQMNHVHIVAYGDSGTV